VSIETPWSRVPQYRVWTQACRLLAQTGFPNLVLARAVKPKMSKARLREVVRSEALTRNCSRCSTIPSYEDFLGGGDEPRFCDQAPVSSVGVLIASLKSVVAQTAVACARSGRAKALGRKRAAYWRALGFPNVAKPER